MILLASHASPCRADALVNRRRRRGDFGPLMADMSQWFVRHRGIAVGMAASGNYIRGALWPRCCSKRSRPRAGAT